MQQILVCILSRKQKNVYLVEIATQNIKLAFKSRNWLWFKKKSDYIVEWMFNTTVSLHEPNKAPVRLSLVLNFRSRQFILRDLVRFSTG